MFKHQVSSEILCFKSKPRSPIESVSRLESLLARDVQGHADASFSAYIRGAWKRVEETKGTFVSYGVINRYPWKWLSPSPRAERP